MIVSFPMSSIRVLLPVKPLNLAKSRLDLPVSARQQVAERLFEHTLEVALKCVRRQQVFVLTADPRVQGRAQRMGVGTIEDSDDNLNTSLSAGLQTLRMRFPNDPLAVLVTDLPQLEPAALISTLLLAATSKRPRHVVDQHGTGTTFVSVPPRTDLPMLFGPHSAHRFRAAGSVPIPPANVGISHDLDLIADLDALDESMKENLCLPTASP